MTCPVAFMINDHLTPPRYISYQFHKYLMHHIFSSYQYHVLNNFVKTYFLQCTLKLYFMSKEWYSHTASWIRVARLFFSLSGNRPKGSAFTYLAPEYGCFLETMCDIDGFYRLRRCFYGDCKVDARRLFYRSSS